MSFRQHLHERAKGVNARVVLVEGDDPRVRAAAKEITEQGIAKVIVIGSRDLDPAHDSRLTAHVFDRGDDIRITSAPAQVC